MARVYTPRNYQRIISAHETELPRSGVWASPGTGKTVATLTHADGLQFCGDMPEPFLVLAPKLVAETTWHREAKKWAHLEHMEIQPILGDIRARRKALLNSNAAGFTINYENMPWLVEELGDRWPFRLVVGDEATRLKGFRLGGHGGQRARAIGKVAHKHVRRWINLTGTPAANGYIDLWGQTWFLDAGKRLGRTFTAFRDRWYRRTFDGDGFELMPASREQIDDRIRDLHVSIGPEWLGVDAPIENVIRVDLPPRARALYRDMEREMFMAIGGSEIEAFNAASRTMKCLQLANGAAYTDDQGTWAEVHDMKLRALDSLVEELNGSPVLVAVNFRSDMARIERTFTHAINVATSEGLARALRGEGRLWYGHPKSMGHGVDGLQDHCHTVAIFGHWWSLEEYQQFIERVGPTRQKQGGYNRAVHIHHIVATDTVDELVLLRRENKRSVQDLLLEAMRRSV